MMGGEREKGWGVDLGADTARQDPQLTNRLGRFRIWALIVNVLTAPPVQEAQLQNLLQYPVSPNTFLLHESVLLHQGGGTVL